MLTFAIPGVPWWKLLALVPLFYALFLYVKVIAPIVEELTDRGDPELDERELMIRNRAYYHAYKMLSVVFGLSLTYALFTTVFFRDAGLPVPKMVGKFAQLALLLAYLVVALPASVIAWAEPDPHLEDEILEDQIGRKETRYE